MADVGENKALGTVEDVEVDLNDADHVLAEHDVVAERGNLFVQVGPGHFAQTNPQPVTLTQEFQLGVDKLTKDVLHEIGEIGSSGNKYR